MERIKVSGLSAVQGIGINQLYSAPSRAANTNYTNTTGKPILVMIERYGYAAVNVYIDGVAFRYCYQGSTTSEVNSVTFIVPNGSVYYTNSTFTTWLELR